VIKDKTPLPLISEILDKLKEASIFNKFDIIWGYNNVWMKEGHKWKAAFLTNSHVLQTMQLSRNLPMNNVYHILKTHTGQHIDQLYG
jgi:hypothetical protein